VISFTPEEQKKLITERVECTIRSLLEDLVVGAWLVYGLSRHEPNGELHMFASGIINTFELHKSGWQTSRLIPSRMMLEGEDATLDERITQYCDEARKNEGELRNSLIMMITAVKMKSSDRPQDLMRQWVLNATERHGMSFDQADSTGDRPNLVLPNDRRVQ
jgi:hypothetical protein